MRSQRPQAWSIVEREDGTFDVTRGNRPVVTGLSAAASARDVIRGGRHPGERVWHVESDGYRTDATREYQGDDERRQQIRRESTVPRQGMTARQRYLARYGRGRPAH